MLWPVVSNFFFSVPLETLSQLSLYSSKFISSHYLSLTSAFICSFTWLTPPGPYRVTTCRGRELNFGSYTYFFDHTRTWRASPYERSADRRGQLRDSTNMKDDTHQAHTQSFQQGEYETLIMAAKWYVGLKFPDICLTGEEKPRPGSLSRPGIESGPAA